MTRVVETWPHRLVDDGEIGPLSALTVNDGFASGALAAGSVSANAGTLNEISAIAGYADVASGELVFALVGNGLPMPTQSAHSQDPFVRPGSVSIADSRAPSTSTATVRRTG